MILFGTGAQVKTVTETISAGIQVVMEAVILSVTGVWHTQGANRIIIAIRVIFLLKRIDCISEISAHHCKRSFRVMRVNLGLLKVACCLSI